jgi:hypothetical protein
VSVLHRNFQQEFFDLKRRDMLRGFRVAPPLQVGTPDADTIIRFQSYRSQLPK